MASLFPGLRRAAPRLFRELFVCHQCMKRSAPAIRHVKKPILRSVRYHSTAAPPEGAFSNGNASPLRSLSDSIGNESARAHTKRKEFFPETNSNSVAYWLLGSAASVFGIVTFGGLTRLTESGYVPFQAYTYIC